MALRSKDRTKPTHYPFLPFHLLRSAQLVSSVIVAGIMAYFLWQLDHENYSLPWTFILVRKPYSHCSKIKPHFCQSVQSIEGINTDVPLAPHSLGPHSRLPYRNHSSPYLPRTVSAPQPRPKLRPLRALGHRLRSTELVDQRSSIACLQQKELDK